MQIRVRKKEKQYAQVHKNLLLNQTLSIQAKGIGSIIECYSDNFILSNKSLEINSNISGSTLRRYLRELEKNLYLYRLQIPRKNFESIWFFDSEFLDLLFIHEEVRKLQKTEKLVFITDYKICAGGKIAYDKLGIYNNTTFDVVEAYKILEKLEVDEDEKFNNLNNSMVNKQIKKDTRLNISDTTRQDNQLLNDLSASSTHNSVPEFVPKDEVEF